MSTRREFLRTSAHLAAVAGVSACAAERRLDLNQGIEVNDVQSQLNATTVRQIAEPTSMDELQALLRTARRERLYVSIAGGRHSMGGQQFGRGTLMVDTRRLNRVVSLDRSSGRIEVEAGIQWPELLEYLQREQQASGGAWSIRQKQTGVDRVTIGGSLSSNIHGRGLRFAPMVEDIESFVLVDARGKVHTCSRRENPELFALAIGGYGLFGVVTHVTLRLVPRTRIERVVEVIAVKDLLPWVDRRLQEGSVYGDCQYSTDLDSDPAFHAGILSCYRPVGKHVVVPEQQTQLSAGDWAELYTLARSDKRRAFERYSEYYRSTSGQIYWSDTHQLAGNFDGYREAVDKRRGTEMITEVYVSRDAFLPLLSQVRRDFLDHGVDMTYGTIRFIEKDSETFLAWATEPSVCIVCNLHVRHTEDGKAKAARDFRRIIDRAIEHGGRYFLTYHRWADRRQIEACYPQFVEFLKLKRKYDPVERFQSDWYRHHKAMFADQL